MKNIIVVLLSLGCSFNAFAQVAGNDTARKNIVDTLKKDLFTAPDTVQHLRSKALSLVPPAALVGYGVASFYIKPMRRLDRYVYKEAQEHNFVFKRHYEDYFQYAPPVLVYGLNLAGVHGKNTFIDRTLIYVMAQGMMSFSLYALKHSTRRLRPDGSDRLSFPSGHTANAFAGAEFMAQELGGVSPYYSVVGYAFATTTGVFRIYHEDHWLSDVIAGAGFGILATKGAYLLYPYLRNAIFKNKTSATKTDEKHKENMSSTLLLPSYQNGALGLTFSASF
ncbi:phosphatase PAP2 family protein [Mucilaginibacter daejeonensis]|uniref:phosphatase PAP2 family protein n=1 Tax=Mucilaginibacter daejeonensis TaxID=398049 RepID=UPI001D179D5A|nr:phosphatase PAP2 family protein [Mucilaginibacter daejeonensis]UEG55178.1 phosphatase PAP2 family protein [Mucilaginibacter daejeonensis]